MIARLIVTAALVGLALVAGGSQLDRTSRFAPQLAPAVPAPFRGFALSRLTEQAVAARNGAQAVALARELVRVRPLPAENLALLSQAALVNGDVPLGLAALEEAGKRSWREPLSQSALAQAALADGNAEAAALRVSALLATGTLEREVLGSLVAALTATPEGREALAARMAEKGYWQRNFGPIAEAALDPQVHADLLQRAARRGAAPDCAVTARVAQQVREAGNDALAAAIWPVEQCPVEA